jgi:Protein of unknown function (DUF3309)
MLPAFLIVLLVLLLIGALPTWPYCACWGYAPAIAACNALAYGAGIYEPEMTPRAQATATQRMRRPGWID